MTASLAIRDSHKLSDDTRRRVRAIARQMGYAWSPAMSELMRSLRVGGSVRYRETIAVLIDRGFCQSHRQQMFAGISTHAEQMGFRVDTFDSPVGESSGSCLRRALETRSIRGVIVLPLATPRDLTNVLPVAEFRVVTTCYSCGLAKATRVVPDYFSGARRFLAEVERRGFRRCGFLGVGRGFAEQVGHTIQAAFAHWQPADGGRPIPPLAWDRAHGSSVIQEWLMAHEIDLVATNAPDVARRAMGGGRQDGGRCRPEVMYFGGWTRVGEGHEGTSSISRQIGRVALGRLVGLLAETRTISVNVAETVLLDLGSGSCNPEL